MTDLQDRILDALVGSPVGAGWAEGPFKRAAEVIPGPAIEFTGRYGDRPAKTAVARRLSYPMMLLESAQGVNFLLKSEADRRAFAMTVLRSIPPGGKPRPRPREAYAAAAADLTGRAHALVCRDPACRVGDRLTTLAGTPPARRGPAVRELEAEVCPTFGGSAAKAPAVTVRTPAIARSMVAVARCAQMYRSFYPYLACEAVREAARTAAAVGGVEEAVRYCLDLARQLGMETA